MTTNDATAQSSWFVNTALSELTVGMDGDPRATGNGHEIGADDSTR